MRFITVALAAGMTLAGSTALLRTDPATHLARVRLIVVGTAPTTDIKVAGATLASYTSTMLRPASGSGASQTGDTMRMSNRAPGQTAEAVFDLILAGVLPGNTITWNVATSRSAETSIEVFSLNNPAVPQLIDRFTVDGVAGQLKTDSGRLASTGAVSVRPALPHLVLAHYYPWYSLQSWRDPELVDQPLQPYSTDDQGDLNRQAAQAQSAGIDAFAVSWQGRANASNDHRMLMMLEAARRVGMRACVYFETYLINSTNDPSHPTDPESMAEWLENAVDMYGGHPAYLRVNDRPVVLVYAASRLSEAEWKRALTSVRARGRNPIVIGDFFHSRLINVLDGEYQYINVSLSPVDLLDKYRIEALRVRTFNLLVPGDVRRIWVASVCPGYDDRRLTSRSEHTFVDRANGAVYEDQWRAAVTMAADWVVITTWNEYFENTGIEPSVRNGTSYLDATRKWAATFKRSGFSVRPAP